MSEPEWEPSCRAPSEGSGPGVGLLFVSLSPLPPTRAGVVRGNQSRTLSVLSHSAQKVGYFLKSVMAFFFHEKKVSPLPLGTFFLQFKKR